MLECILVPLYVSLHIYFYSIVISSIVMLLNIYMLKTSKFVTSSWIAPLNTGLTYLSAAYLTFHLDDNKNFKINMSKLENVSSKVPSKSLPPTLLSISDNGRILRYSSHFFHTLHCIFVLVLLCVLSKYNQHVIISHSLYYFNFCCSHLRLTWVFKSPPNWSLFFHLGL